MRRQKIGAKTYHNSFILQAYHYVPEDTTCAVLFMDMVPINN
jgi:hypothetical protein